MTSTPKRIAVLYATEQGSTRDIADFIAENLTARGGHVEVSEVEHAPELSLFDAVVLGSAVHDMNLLPAAEGYIRAHDRELRETDLWLFTVGLGPALRGPIGGRLARRVPPDIARLRDLVQPRDYRAFAGVYQRAGLPLSTRLRYRAMGGGRYGDLRDWASIRAWADEIATALGLAQETAGTRKTVGTEHGNSR
ncbi:MAG TPA: flavodoxin domain-containing protein [Nocardia sp.]|uniref:flavodoxin domain-containing protein n=1 Tax=Nocardia TaxID=1817 RepID=UPI002458994E|nr:MULTISPECIES: flavodoxin domain-containing protein [Nocardia]HLS77453.1 flavodoxin domain-containing protein [Nocardia sp.]